MMSAMTWEHDDGTPCPNTYGTYRCAEHGRDTRRSSQDVGAVDECCAKATRQAWTDAAYALDTLPRNISGEAHSMAVEWAYTVAKRYLLSTYGDANARQASP